MVTAEKPTYEKLYYSLWEMSRRYGSFVQFRVIGKSHDDRMIPMVEIGEGEECVFCLGGLDGTDRFMPACLVKMAEDYCQAYECGWILGEDYQVRKLLDKIRICFVPVLNPDGYEIYEKGYKTIRNPVFRQMIRMQNVPNREFICNARGVNLRENFPTSYYIRKFIHEQPASENETKALIRILQEYNSKGLLSFGYSGKKIVYYRQEKSFSYNQKNYRMARHLQKCSGYSLERGKNVPDMIRSPRGTSSGSPEQFYAEVVKQPSLMIETPILADEEKSSRELSLLPLEYIR